MDTNLRTCDKKGCPAEALCLIAFEIGEIILCQHHFNEVIPIVMERGLEVHVRPSLVTT